jgi:hypothetical protein
MNFLQAAQEADEWTIKHSIALDHACPRQHSSWRVWSSSITLLYCTYGSRLRIAESQQLYHHTSYTRY